MLFFGQPNNWPSLGPKLFCFAMSVHFGGLTMQTWTTTDVVNEPAPFFANGAAALIIMCIYLWLSWRLASTLFDESLLSSDDLLSDNTFQKLVLSSLCLITGSSTLYWIAFCETGKEDVGPWCVLALVSFLVATVLDKQMGYQLRQLHEFARKTKP